MNGTDASISPEMIFTDIPMDLATFTLSRRLTMLLITVSRLFSTTRANIPERSGRSGLTLSSPLTSKTSLSLPTLPNARLTMPRHGRAAVPRLSAIPLETPQPSR